MQCNIHPRTIARHILIQYNNSTSLLDIAMYFNILYYKKCNIKKMTFIKLYMVISFYSEILVQNIPLCLLSFIYIYMPILYILTYKMIYLLSPSICLYKTIIPSKYSIRVTCVPETQMNKDANEDGWELVMNRKQRRIYHNIRKWETFKQMNPTSTMSSNSSITSTTLTLTISYSETGKII